MKVNTNHLLHLSSLCNWSRDHNPKDRSQTTWLPCASQFPYHEQERNIQSAVKFDNINLITKQCHKV